MRLLPFLFILFFSNSLTAVTDSTKLITWEQYLQAVFHFHPLVQNSRLLEDEAAAKLLKARGGFDPKLEGNADRKSFGGKNYFTTLDGSLKFPSWWGMEFKMGYKWNSGINLNPEVTLPENGQAILGVDITLLQGLLLDQRRVDLQQARLMRQYNLTEQNRIINELVFSAGKAYWEWALAQQSLRIRGEALRLSRIRLDNIRQQFLQGDKPAVDTLEASIQVQSWEIEYEQGLVELQNARLGASVFLWSERQEPVILRAEMQPLPLSPAIEVALPEDDNIIQLANRHPEVMQYEIKAKQIEIDRRWKKEQLKPQLTVGFNFLGDGFDFINRPSGNDEVSTLRTLLTENYKFSARLVQPLFLRKERANLDLVKLKLINNNNRRQQKRQEIINKIITYRNQLSTLARQITLQEQMATQYQRLLEAENEKFRIGESSIFLLNSREQKLIELQLKQVKLWSNYQKSRLGMEWAAGSLANNN